MGVILLHPTSNKTAMTKNFARQFSKVAPSGENMALFRRFGHKVSAERLILPLGLYWGRKYSFPWVA